VAAVAAMPQALYVLSYADFDRYYESYCKDAGRGELGQQWTEDLTLTAHMCWCVEG
jgi:hypothetical protein